MSENTFPDITVHLSCRCGSSINVAGVMYLSDEKYIIWATAFAAYSRKKLRSIFNGSKIFGTMEICSRYGQFEPLRVNQCAMSGGKW